MGGSIGGPRNQPCTGKPAKPANTGFGSSRKTASPTANAAATLTLNLKPHPPTGVVSGFPNPSLLSLSFLLFKNERHRNR